MIANWVSVVSSFYTIQFNLKYLPGNIYTNTYMMYIAAVTGSLSAGYLLKHISLKRMLISCNLTMCIGVLLILGFGFEHESEWLLPFLLLLSIFGCSQGFNTIYQGNNRLFPTLFTATSIGICNLIARGVTIASPEIAEIPG
jgi:hypothetical protein